MTQRPYKLSANEVRWHLGHLDALRGIAILGVVLVHSAFAERLPERGTSVIWDLSFFGQRGVQLFFVVSAFTLFLSLSNRKQECSPTRNFFLRRFFRIAPLFYVSTLLTLCFYRSAAGPARDIWLSVFFLNGFSWPSIIHGAIGSWSIADEAIFYMLLPLLHRWIGSLRASLYALLIVGPVSFLVAAAGEHYARSPAAVEYSTFLSFAVEFPVFLLGIAAYFLWQEFGNFAALSPEHRRMLSIFVLISIALAFRAELPSTNHKLWAGSMLCALFLLALTLHPWRLFVNRITIYLGKISYSLYLLHFYAVERIHQLLPAPDIAPPVLRNPSIRLLLTFLLILLVTCPVATASWLWIEKPGIRLGRRLIAYLENRKRQSNHLVPQLEAVVRATNSPDAQF